MGAWKLPRGDCGGRLVPRPKATRLQLPNARQLSTYRVSKTARCRRVSTQRQPPPHPQRLMYRFLRGTDEDRSGLFKMIVRGGVRCVWGAFAVQEQSDREAPQRGGAAAMMGPFGWELHCRGHCPAIGIRVRVWCRSFRPLNYHRLSQSSPLPPPKPHIAQGSWVIRSAVGTTPVIVARKLASSFFVTGGHQAVSAAPACWASWFCYCRPDLLNPHLPGCLPRLPACPASPSPNPFCNPP